MPRWPMEIPAETLQRARELRETGTSWASIGARLGYSTRTIRARVDPTFLWSDRSLGPVTAFVRMGEVRISKEEADRAVAAVPPDTRSAQARLMGDPLPGRSALDKKKRSFPAVPQLPSQAHREQTPILHQQKYAALSETAHSISEAVH